VGPTPSSVTTTSRWPMALSIASQQMAMLRFTTKPRANDNMAPKEAAKVGKDRSVQESTGKAWA